MKFAMIGLGKMGLNLVKNAVDNGHEVVAFDLTLTLLRKQLTIQHQLKLLLTLMICCQSCHLQRQFGLWCQLVYQLTQQSIH